MAVFLKVRSRSFPTKILDGIKDRYIRSQGGEGGNDKASFHELRSDSDSWRVLRIDGCQSCQSRGMSSTWGTEIG
jgi:hypothetical protein